MIFFLGVFECCLGYSEVVIWIKICTGIVPIAILIVANIVNLPVNIKDARAIFLHDVDHAMRTCINC